MLTEIHSVYRKPIENKEVKSESVIENLIKELNFIDKPIQNEVSEILQKPRSNPTVTTRIARNAEIYILNECIDKLAMLRIILGQEIDPLWNENLEYRSLESKFGNEELDREDFELYQYTNAKKITKDMSCIYNILYNALHQLRRYNNYNYINEAVNIIDMEENDILQLHNEIVRNANIASSGTSELQTLRMRKSLIINKKLDEIAHIKEAYEDLKFYLEIELNYISNWENNRCYLNNFIHNQAEMELQGCIKKYQQKSDFEDRVHTEISKYIAESRVMTDGEIEYWMKHYDEQVDKMESKIYEVKVARDSCETSIRILSQEYNSRMKEIEEYLEIREKRRKKKELDALLNSAATRIQAWWRGTMVRKHLGPYRKGKAGKKRKDKQKSNKQGLTRKVSGKSITTN